MRRFGVLVVAVASILCVSAAGSADASGPRSVKVVRWVDGDTAETTAGTVRLIGVDTPERGACGSKRATALAQRLAPAGARIRLRNPRSVDDTDRYGRLLRYVNRGRVDIAKRQIRAGAVARYDSLDGYDRHPRQRAYRKTDRKHRDYCSDRNSDGGKDGGGGGGGDMKSYPPIAGTWNCPRHAPIKGNQGDEEWIYHKPGQQYYDATNPEECFATAAGAERAGYRAAKV